MVMKQLDTLVSSVEISEGRVGFTIGIENPGRHHEVTCLQYCSELLCKPRGRHVGITESKMGLKGPSVFLGEPRKDQVDCEFKFPLQHLQRNSIYHVTSLCTT